MALTTAQLIQARRQTISVVFTGGAPIPNTKTEIDAALNAMCTALEASAASINAGLTGTVLAGASATVKAQVLAAVATARYG